MLQLNHVTRKIPEAASVHMNQRVYDLKRRGEDVITLSLGESEFDMPLFDFHKLDSRKIFHYSDSAGIPSLREKIANLYRTKYFCKISSEDIIISAGSKAIIFMVLQAILNSGDEVLIPEPAWLSYREQAKLAGGSARFIPIETSPRDYKKFFTSSTRILILNNPNNPAGILYSREDIEEIARDCEKNQIYLLIDEAYSDFVGEEEFFSAARLIQNYEGIVVVNSLSKNFGISGWRIGYCIAQKFLRDEILKLNQHLITCAPTILQMYVAEYFDQILQKTLPQIQKLIEKRKRIESYMSQIGLNFIPGSSTFYFFIDTNGIPSQNLARQLLIEDKIAVVAGDSYGASTGTFIRISIGSESEDRIKHALQKIRDRLEIPKLESPMIMLGGNLLNRGMMRTNQTLVFDWRANPPLTGDLHVQSDIKDLKKILDWLEKNRVEKIRGALTSNDVGVPTQRKIHEHYGFLVPTEKSIEDAMVKGRATKIWRDTGLLTRFSQTFETLPNIEELPQKDLIVKPNFYNASNGITIIRKNDRKNFPTAFEFAKKISIDDKVIIEEFVEGTEFVVDMLGDSFGNVEVWGIAKKYHTPFNRTNRIATKLHYNPADVEDSLLEKIAARGMELYRAIGLQTSLGHLELILDSAGEIHPLEIGARSSGFICSDLNDAINPPRSLIDEYFEVIRGKKIGNGYTARNDLSSMYFFYDFGRCTIQRESNLMEFLPSTIRSIYNDRGALKIGRQLEILQADGERIGYEILTGARKDLTIETIFDAEQKLFLKIKGESV